MAKSLSMVKIIQKQLVQRSHLISESFSRSYVWHSPKNDCVRKYVILLAKEVKRSLKLARCKNHYQFFRKII